MKKFSLLLGLVAVSMFVIGCGEPQTTGSGSNNTQEEDPHAGHNHDGGGHDGHDHAAHDHSPKHGGHDQVTAVLR